MDEKQSLFENYEAAYVNVHSKNKEEFIHIPCSSEKDEFGFDIFGIKEEKRCYHPYLSILALVYNFTRVFFIAFCKNKKWWKILPWIDVWRNLSEVRKWDWQI